MKTKLFSLLIASIICTPLTTLANNGDSKYPAANFEPKVIFVDESVEVAGDTSTFDADYPAANFQPKILYVDASVAAQTSSSTVAAEKSTFDPKFPAANFEPKVIYP